MDETLPEDADNFGLRRNALALRLQQRRPRKVLADQGIIAPLKSPGTYFEQMQKLDRARKEDYLNHAFQNRPIRDILVQKHILEDTSAANSIQAHQKDLKKAKLVDDLNDKIAFRPGVIELVERNIFPATEPLQEALKGGHLQYKKISDLVDEDSSDALSPEQAPPPPTSSPPLVLQITTAFSSPNTISISDRTSVIKNDAPTLLKSSSSSSLFTQNCTHPYLSRQISKGSKSGQASVIPRMSSSRKKKEKPKIKKFKYHQYVPPDQGHGKSKDVTALPTDINGDTPYTRLLQQQQLYLQLQIMNKRYSTQLSGQRSGESSQQSSTFSQQGMINPPPPPPLTQTMKIEKPRKLSSVLTPSKLDEMKVTELKEELKLRGLKVTGTKEVLIERLKPFCTKNDSVFLSEPQPIDETTSTSFGSAASPPSVNEVTFTNVDDVQLQTTMQAGVAVGQVSSESATFSFDPNTVFTHKMARMPVPEQHKIILKQEKFTMPTWNCSVQDGNAVTMVTTSGANHPPQVDFVTSGDMTKDLLLEKQKKEINDLRRMVELHRSQLLQLQDTKGGAAGQQAVENPIENSHVIQPKLEFPARNYPQPSTQFCSSNPTPPSARTGFHRPPNYKQAYEMLHNGNGRADTVNRQMDDLLELLADTGELPTTPVVTRQLLNDHPSYTGLSDTSNIVHHHGYGQRHHQRLPSSEYSAVVGHDVASQKLQQQGYPPQGRDFCSPDLTKMLVETAGDALMDTSSFPPIINSPGSMIDPQVDNPPSLPPYSRASARNSVDSGIIYSTSHYSPMDTNLDGSSKDLLNDLHLSTSSLDSGEPTLNAVSLSPATPPRAMYNLQSNYRSLASPRPLHNHLMKSASQELLSTSGDIPAAAQRPMDNDLGWLDLTLGSATGAPPSPGGPFTSFSFDDSHPQHFGHHQPAPCNNFYEQDPGVAPSGSTGALNLTHGAVNSGLEQWDPFDGLLGTGFNG